MSFLTNPIVLCASIALGIILLLIIVVVICCKKGSITEREELMAISDEIESNSIEDAITTEDKIEDVLSKMQETLETKEEMTCTFEEEQEENAIISYQELLNSLGGKSSIDVDSIEVFEDELEGNIEISDFNKEIIEAYQNENLDREIYRFQNDYSNEALSTEIVNDIPQFVNFEQNVSYVEEEYVPTHEVMELKNNVADKNNTVDNAFTNRNFKKSEIISPVYGIMDEKKIEEEIIFEDDSLLDEF